ncbi:MAG: family 78 glycoside hydrolase catalytic domain [Bacteroidaceae bacterium]|nr:family 78 glycoside hydrolase catalytic domain [Bacteroidaceae bacterium]
MKKYFFFLLTLCISIQVWPLNVNHLRVQSLPNPQGVDSKSPLFSWHLQSNERSVVQTAYQLVVTSDAQGETVVWDSGLVQSASSVGVKASGLSLKPSTRYFWHVTVQDNKGNVATSTETAYFDTGLMSSAKNPLSPAIWIKASNLKNGEQEEEIKNYTIEAKVRIEHSAAGICFGMQDEGNFYFWQLNTEGTYSRLRPHQWTGGNASCLANVNLSGKVALNNTDEFTLRIEISNASRARTYINNVLVDTRTGNFKYGKVGMREAEGESDGQPEIGVYDDIVVRKSDGTVLFSENFSSSNTFTGGTLVNGKLRIVGVTGGNVYAWQRSLTGNGHTHYAIDYDMYLVQASAAIIFAHTGSNTYHMWQINCHDHSKPAVRRHVYINGKLTYDDNQFDGFTKAQLLGSLHHYRIEVQDGIIKTYVDGLLVDTFNDTSGTAVMGDIGMRIDTSGGGEEAYYDNLTLTTYDEEGNSTVALSEDFENLSSEYFYDAVIEEMAGSRMCHVQSGSGEKKVMQSQTEGVPMFRKEFALTKAIRTAKLYTSGLGVYDVFINGQRVGHVQHDGSTLYEELKPGWTDYRSRVFYSSHDVTSLLTQGNNVIGAIVTSGWWAGAVMHGIYGSPQPGFIAKLLVTYEDGTQETLNTDLTWQSSKNGALKAGEIYDGEIYDARFESAWTTAAYDDSQWNGVEQNTDFNGQINAFTGGYVLQLRDKVQTVKKATIYEGSKNTGSTYGMINVVSTQNTDKIQLRKGQAVILDFGQNIVGWTRFKVRGKTGNRLRMRFTEMLNDTGDKNRGNDGPGGSLYLANLRSAKAQLYYTLAGKDGGEEYQPSTTFFGFRYCEILPSDDLEILSIEAQPISSSTDDTGSFTTSNPQVNQLYSNITWGQRGNLLSIPTDCPQRDERLGWTADTQIFSHTAMYIADTESFYRKWMQDMRDSQNSNGAYPDVAPHNWVGFGNSAWADAGIVVPWNIYLMYGDKEALRENFTSMEKYMNWLATQTGDGYKYQGAGLAYGDWLSFVNTETRYVSVAYYAYDAQLMAKMARALSTSNNDSYATKAKAYDRLYENIRSEFRTRYITPTIRQTSQTAYLLALQFNLLSSDAEQNTFKTRLAQAIRNNKYMLNTGFVGTGIINPTLSRFGLTEYAYDLLLQRNCPSWLYSVDQGATTIWERWNSYTIESGFGDPGMNSFNHYAYGAVGEWMYRYMLGIEADEQEPGFHHFILQPQPDRRTILPRGQSLITSASGSYRSRYGEITSAWSAPDKNSLVYDCTVPANSTATLRLPAASEDVIMMESGMPAREAEGITYVGYEDGCMVFTLGSGTYHFTTDGSVGVKAMNEPDIPHSAPVYDLMGRMRIPSTSTPFFHMAALPQGIYITDGRKIVVR